MHDRRRGEAVRYFRLLEESTPYCAHTAFHFRRIIDRKDAEGRVEDVTSHVSQCAGAEAIPAPPVERMVGGIVGDGFSGAEPEIPVEFLRNIKFSGRCRDALWPHRPVRP